MVKLLLVINKDVALKRFQWEKPATLKSKNLKKFVRRAKYTSIKRSITNYCLQNAGTFHHFLGFRVPLQKRKTMKVSKLGVNS